MMFAAPFATEATTWTASGSPPPLTSPSRLFTVWQLDPLLAVGIIVVAVLYLAGVRQLRLRGDRWPVSRTILFVGCGLGIIVIATMSSLGAYDTTLFSVHMGQHMLLSMVAPIFLALGAPVTLALRTLPQTGRRVLLAVLHSKVAKVASFPALTWVLFVTAPYSLYFTGWYEASLRHEWLHEMVHVHFLLIGSLFFWPLVGVDPVPGKLSHPMRLLVMFLSMPLHAILGLSIMNSVTLIAGDYYESLGRTWGGTLLADQGFGGGLLWASGDLVSLLMFGALFVQWMRASEREAEREDRRLDRLEAAEAVEAEHRASRGAVGWGPQAPDR